MHYTSREKCVITGSKDLEPLYTLDNFPVFIGCTDQEQSKDIFADMEWGISKSSGVIQLTKLLSPDIVYSGYHSEAVGSIWKQHHEEFANFIIKHANTTSIVEMGGSNGILAELCCKIDKNINWTVVEPIPDPNYSPSTSKISIKKSFIEDELDLLSNNKLFIHSHVLEHLYDPLTTMNAVVQQQSDGDMMIFSVPDLYKYLDEKYVNTINFEHTYLLTEHVMDYLLGELGFLIKEKKKFKGHSIFYCAELIGKVNAPCPQLNHYDKYKTMYLTMIDHYKNEVMLINSKIQNWHGKVYLFGAHIFSQFLIYMGLDENKFSGILDNSVEKQGKRLYGASLIVSHPTIISDTNDVMIIVKAGQYQSEVEKQLYNLNNKICIIN